MIKFLPFFSAIILSPFAMALHSKKEKPRARIYTHENGFFVAQQVEGDETPTSLTALELEELLVESQRFAIIDGRITKDGQPFSTTQKDDGLEPDYIICIAKDKSIRIANRYHNGNKLVYHSKLLDDDDAVFAGNIEIVDGLITFLSNESGHYRPDSYQLVQTVVFFKQHGLFRGDAKIFFYEQIEGCFIKPDEHGNCNFGVQLDNALKEPRLSDKKKMSSSVWSVRSNYRNHWSSIKSNLGFDGFSLRRDASDRATTHNSLYRILKKAGKATISPLAAKSILRRFVDDKDKVDSDWASSLTIEQLREAVRELFAFASIGDDDLDEVLYPEILNCSDAFSDENIEATAQLMASNNFSCAQKHIAKIVDTKAGTFFDSLRRKANKSQDYEVRIFALFELASLNDDLRRFYDAIAALSERSEKELLRAISTMSTFVQTHQSALGVAEHVEHAVLRLLATDANEKIRVAAINLMGQIDNKGEEATMGLIKVFLNEKSLAVRDAAFDALDVEIDKLDLDMKIKLTIFDVVPQAHLLHTKTVFYHSAEFRDAHNARMIMIDNHTLWLNSDGIIHTHFEDSVDKMPVNQRILRQKRANVALKEVYQAYRDKMEQLARNAFHSKEWGQNYYVPMHMVHAWVNNHDKFAVGSHEFTVLDKKFKLTMTEIMLAENDHLLEEPTVRHIREYSNPDNYVKFSIDKQGRFVGVKQFVDEPACKIVVDEIL